MGLSFGQRPDHFRLSAFVDLTDQGRGVEIPLKLSLKDAQDCVKALSRWIEQQTNSGS